MRGTLRLFLNLLVFAIAALIGYSACFASIWTSYHPIASAPHTPGWITVFRITWFHSLIPAFAVYAVGLVVLLLTPAEVRQKWNSKPMVWAMIGLALVAGAILGILRALVTGVHGVEI